MRKKLKSFSILIVVIFIMTIVFTGVINYVEAAITGALIDVTNTRGSGIVETTTITFTADTAINTNDGIQITFANGFDISAVVNGDVAVTQANGGTDITKGTAGVSGQYLQIPIATQGDTPAGEITITISNSHIINPGPGIKIHTIKTYDLGPDNDFGGGDDVQEESLFYMVVVGANMAGLQDSTGALESAASTAVDTTTILFDPETEINTGDGIQINFASGFNIASVVNADVTLYQDYYTTPIVMGTATVSGQNLQIPITTEGLVPAGSVAITIENSNITTPSAGTYIITVTTWDLGGNNEFGGGDDTLEDTYSMAVVIGESGVTISASVDPVLTLSLSATTCDLGTFQPNLVNTCNYYADVSTQSTNGYIAYIREDTNLLHTNGSDDIDDETGDSDVDADVGAEEYGVSTTESASVNIVKINDADSDFDFDVTDCTTMDGNTITANASAITTSDQSFATDTGPVANDTTYLCHAATITGATTAGSYSHTITITLIASF